MKLTDEERKQLNELLTKLADMKPVPKAEKPEHNALTQYFEYTRMFIQTLTETNAMLVQAYENLESRIESLENIIGKGEKENE